MKNKAFAVLPALCLLSTSLFGEVSPLFTKRYSTYSYDSSKTVSKEQLETIIEAGRLAPSCYNEQPWNFIICDRASNPKAYEKALGGLVEFNQNWAKNAPVLVIAISDGKFARNGETNQWANYDTGAATYSMMLQASALGLVAHQMGGYDEAQLKKSFAIPDEFTVMSVMAIGYANKDDVQTERKRKPTAENFFMGSWDKK